jgi:hypothetical protein
MNEPFFDAYDGELPVGCTDCIHNAYCTHYDPEHCLDFELDDE